MKPRPFRVTRSGGAEAALLLPALLVLTALLLPAAARGGNSSEITVDDNCVAMAYAPDGRIVYATRHVYWIKKLQVQRDDIYVWSPDGKRKKIVNGEKLVQGAAAFSYTVKSLRWSPDSSKLTAQLLTARMVDARGATEEGQATLLLDDTGKEIKIAGADSIIPQSYDAAWLADSQSVVYLEEAVKPQLLYSLGLVRPAAGRGGAILTSHAFVAIAWKAKENSAVAVERDASLSGPPRLVELDLAKETRRLVTVLPAYQGGFSLSPSGTKVAYYADGDTLEIRDLAQPSRVARVRIGYGTYQWAKDERHILFKRGLEKNSGNLAWIALPDLAAASNDNIPTTEPTPQPVLHSLTFRDFEISPDGQRLAVIQPGTGKLVLYPLP